MEPKAQSQKDGDYMSHTFSLTCDETKQKLWIGQGWHKMTTFYSGDSAVMERLKKFLDTTQGKALVLRCDDSDPTHDDYEEFLDPEADFDCGG